MTTRFKRDKYLTRAIKACLDNIIHSPHTKESAIHNTAVMTCAVDIRDLMSYEAAIEIDLSMVNKDDD